MQIKLNSLALALLLAVGLGVASSTARAQSSSTGNVSELSTTCGTGGSTNGRVKLHFPSSIGLIPASTTVTLTGTFAATLTFEQSADNGTTWTEATGTPQPSGSPSTSTTSTGIWVFDVASRTDFCVRGSAYTSGSAYVVIQSSPAQLSSGTGVGGLSDLNGLTVSTQLFTVGTDGVDFNIQSDVDTHTFNLPDASCTFRGAVNGVAQIFCGNKTFQGDTLMQGSLYVTDYFSTDYPVEITGEACTVSEANVGLFGFDPVTGEPCFSYDGSAPGPVGGIPRLDQILDPTADKTFAMGNYALGLKFGSGSFVIDPSPMRAWFGLKNAPNDVIWSLGAFHEDDMSGNQNPAAFIAETSSTNSFDSVRGIWGADIQAFHDGNGALGSMTGLEVIVVNDQFGQVGTATGIYAQVYPLHYPTIDTVYGVRSETYYDAGSTSYAFYASGNASSYFGAPIIVKSNGARIQPQIFTGAGLNDATSGGAYTALDDLAYCVKIDGSVPSPDTFSWGTAGSCVNGATGVGITGAAQALSNGVTVTFVAVDGHTVTNSWTFTAYAPIPLTLQNSSGNITAKVRQTGDVLARRFIASTGTALVDGDFVPSGGWGASGSVAVTSASTDQSFHITVTAAGAGQGLNPTVAFTFKDLTWTTVPIFTCTMETGGTGALSFFTPDNTSATVLTLTYAGTPVINLTYKLACNAWGH